MLADAKGIDANLIGEDGFVDYVADDLCVRQELTVGSSCDVAESIEPKLEMLCHIRYSRWSLAPGGVAGNAPAISDR
jgi:hypothetical protein